MQSEKFADVVTFGIESFEFQHAWSSLIARLSDFPEMLFRLFSLSFYILPHLVSDF